MPELDQRLRVAIDRAAAELKEEARRRGFRDVVLRPHAPADAEAIARLESHSQIRLPASYRAFLLMHDGYEGLAYGGNMLSVDEMLPGSKRYEEVNAWKRLSADYGSGEVIDAIVIGSSTEPNNWLFIDPNRSAGNGEFVLVRWLGDTSQDFSDLVEFLDYVVLACRSDLPESER